MIVAKIVEVPTIWCRLVDYQKSDSRASLWNMWFIRTSCTISTSKIHWLTNSTAFANIVHASCNWSWLYMTSPGRLTNDCRLTSSMDFSKALWCGPTSEAFVETRPLWYPRTNPYVDCGLPDAKNAEGCRWRWTFRLGTGPIRRSARYCTRSVIILIIY